MISPITMRKFLAQASGATLGYIWKDRAGAVSGWELGGRLFDQYGRRAVSGSTVERTIMPPIPRGRSRSRAPVNTRKRFRNVSRSNPYFAKRRRTQSISRTRFSRPTGKNGRRKFRRAMAGMGPTSKFFLRLRRGIRPLKGYRKVGAPHHINSITQLKISSAPQRQGINNIPLFFSNLGGIQDQSFAVPSAIDTERMIENLVVDDTASFGLNTYRYFIPYIKLKIRCRNMTTGPLDVWLYDCIARRDQKLEPTTGYLMAAAPVVSWVAGLANEAVAGLGTRPPDYQFPGQTPFESERFCQYWHVRGVTKRTLGAGQEHVHYVTLSLNRLHNREFTKDLAAYARESYACMAVIKAGVYQSEEDGAYIMYGQGQLDCIVEYHAMVQAMGKNRTIVSNYQADYVFTGALEQVTEDTDVVAAQDVVG